MLRGVVSIFLLTLLLFNCIGYYGLYVVVKKQISRTFREELDADEYAGGDAMIVKVPVRLPYQANFNAYERLDGEFERDGEFYRIAKYRIVHDTLLVVLVKSKREADLHGSVVDFALASSDSPVAKSALKLISGFLKEFIPHKSNVQTGSLGWYLALSPTRIDAPLISLFLPLVSPPPKSFRLKT